MRDSDSDDSDLTPLSSPLTSLASSPEPPDFLPPQFINPYLTPASSQDHSACNSGSEKEQDRRKRARANDELPLAKKRKTAEVIPRTTVHLDLRASKLTPIEPSAQLDLLLKVLRKRRKIVVIAGAGISTSAGVPDFRSSNGLFKTLRSDNKTKASGKHLFDASVYQTDDSTSSFHDMVRTLSQVVRNAKPTAFHNMLATLATEGRLMRLYTQNVDGIDTSLDSLKTQIPLTSKGPWPRTIQLHGSLETMECTKCCDRSKFDPCLFNGPVPPSCTACMALDVARTEHGGKRSHGIGKLRPRMVLYNEHNPDADAIGTVMAADLRGRPDAVIVVGTSMEIPGVKRLVREMCGVVRDRKDGLAVWINRGPPPSGKEFEDCWDLVVAGDCDTVAKHADLEGHRVTESEAERAKTKAKVAVLVSTPKKKEKTSSVPGLVTPAASPKLDEATKPKIILKITPRTSDDKGKPRSDSLAASKNSKRIDSKAPAKKKATKPATSKTSEASKINHTFKVTKMQSSVTHEINAGKPSAKGEIGKPIEPLSPQSARCNGGIPLPNLKVEIPTSPQMGRLRRLSEEKPPPISSVPKGLENMLELSNDRVS